MSSKVWDEITNPFSNFNFTVEIWQFVNNFIEHFTGYAIIYLHLWSMVMEK